METAAAAGPRSQGDKEDHHHDHHHYRNYQDSPRRGRNKEDRWHQERINLRRGHPDRWGPRFDPHPNGAEVVSRRPRKRLGSMTISPTIPDVNPSKPEGPEDLLSRSGPHPNRAQVNRRPRQRPSSTTISPTVMNINSSKPEGPTDDLPSSIGPDLNGAEVSQPPHQSRDSTNASDESTTSSATVLDEDAPNKTIQDMTTTTTLPSAPPAPQTQQTPEGSSSDLPSSGFVSV